MIIIKKRLTHTHTYMIVRTAVLVLPWILLVVSATFLALGLSWRHLTDSDTVNGTFIVLSIAFAALTVVCLCVREIPDRVEPKEEEEKKPPATTARIPLVTVS